MSIRPVARQREHTAASDVADVDEVARLPSVLEDDRRPVVEQPGCEDRGDTRVRIGKRLAFAVHIEEAKRHGRNAVRGAHCERHLLVVAFSDRVDRGRPQWLRFGRGLGFERSAVVREELPLARGELRLRPKPGREARLPRLRVSVLPLAVDRHRRGDQQLLDRVAPFEDLLEENRGADCVDRGVPLDLVHRLPDADGGREVNDGVDACQRATDGVAISDVRGDELHLRVEIVRPLFTRMNLRVEGVERANGMSATQQRVREVRPDEPRTASDKNVHGRG